MRKVLRPRPEDYQIGSQIVPSALMLAALLPALVLTALLPALMLAALLATLAAGILLLLARLLLTRLLLAALLRPALVLIHIGHRKALLSRDHPATGQPTSRTIVPVPRSAQV